MGVWVTNETMCEGMWSFIFTDVNGSAIDPIFTTDNTPSIGTTSTDPTKKNLSIYIVKIIGTFIGFEVNNKTVNFNIYVNYENP